LDSLNNMNISPQLVQRVGDLVRRHNRELAFDALLKGSMGIVFSLVTYGVLFWMGWFIGFFVARHLNLQPWQFGAMVAGLFLVVALWSAWQRVDPLAGLKRLSDRQKLLTLISQASPGLLYFSPRHATAGAALILLGGPNNVVEAFGIWAYRLPGAGSLVEEASRLLTSCQTALPAEEVREPVAALLLRRLGLIKVIPSEDSASLTLTDKGLALLGGGKKSRAKRRRNERVDE
jgi:hypothetical protein